MLAATKKVAFKVCPIVPVGDAIIGERSAKLENMDIMRASLRPICRVFFVMYAGGTLFA